MPFKPFPSELQVMTLSNEIKQLGKYSLPEITEIRAARLYFTNHNTNTPELVRFRLRLCSSENPDLFFATSEWLDLSYIVGTASYWFGWVTFKLQETAIVLGETDFYVYAETENYIETADNFMASILDDVPDINVKAASDDFGAAIEFIGLV